MSGAGPVLILAFGALATVRGQTPPAQSVPAFEVATVKAVPPPQVGEQYNINLGAVRNGRVTLGNVTLSDCLKFAYGIVSDSQVSGPDWIKSRAVRFDIVAQADPGTPRDRLLVMLQNLLAERLKLVLHREQRELSYLALVQTKHGSKLRSAKDDAPQTGTPVVLGHIVSFQMSMETLAMLLSRFERQTILDKTGLDGLYEVKLEWDWHRDRPVPPGGDASGVQQQADGGPSIFTALEEQLGLKLEARQGSLEVLVVDSAEKVPAENWGSASAARKGLRSGVAFGLGVTGRDGIVADLAPRGDCPQAAFSSTLGMIGRKDHMGRPSKRSRRGTAIARRAPRAPSDRTFESHGHPL
jgi:uncharacterized protein (TIGR03435 family)